MEPVKNFENDSLIFDVFVASATYFDMKYGHSYSGIQLYPQLAIMQTVGDLYTLVCTELALTPRPPPPPDTGYVHPFRKSSKPLKIQWTPEDVWATLVAIIIDQLQVDREEVLYDAYFQRDLGAD
jgi:hypothetical protein